MPVTPHSPGRPHTALITGASGYIGNHVAAEFLAKGYNVHVLTRPTSNIRSLNTSRITPTTPVTRIAPTTSITRHDIDGSYASILNTFEQAKPDIVLHLASMIEARHTPETIAPMIDANITFGAHLLEAMTRTNCTRLINTGSYWQFDTAGNYCPNTLYAATKQAFSDLIPCYCKSQGLRAITLILFDVYGPNDWRGKLLSALVRAVTLHTPIPLSPGEQLVDMVYVSDVAAGYLQACDLLNPARPSHQVFSLDSGTHTSLRELVDALEAQLGKPIPVEWGAQPYPPHQIMVPTNRLRRLPGWECKVPLEVGLAMLI